MLYLENLEPRCLLSIIITESDGDTNGILQADPVILGETPSESYIDITNNNDSAISVKDIKFLNQDETGPGVNFYTNIPPGVMIDAHMSLRIPVYFDPQNAGNIEEVMRVKSTDGDLPEFRMELSGNGLAVSISPPEDSDLAFGNTGIGQVQQTSVSVLYLNGAEDSTMVISDLQVTGDGFSYEQPPLPQTIPNGYTANEVVELEFGVPVTGTVGTELDPLGEPFLDYYDIYSFTVQPGQIVEVDALLKNYGDLTINIYSASGDIVTWDSEIYVGDGYSVYTNAVIPVPDNPAMDEFLYYVEVAWDYYSTDFVDPDTYQIMVSSSNQTVPDIPIMETPFIPSYQGTIGNQQFYDEEIQWLQFDAEFGDQIGIQIDMDDPDASLLVGIFDNTERLVFADYAPLDPETSMITLLTEGPYYIELIDDMSLSRYDYELTLIDQGSMLELEPGEFLSLPVYFRPDSIDSFTGSLQYNIYADDAVVKSVQYSLEGNSSPGDLVIPPDNYFGSFGGEVGIVHYTDNIFVPNVTQISYDDTPYLFAQSGTPLDVVAVVTNQGTGDIQQSASLVYYLSTDMVYDDLDIPLSSPLTINPLFVGNSDVVIGSVMIPNDLEGQYYLIAVVDPLDLVPEVESGPTDNVPFDYWWVDPVIIEDEIEPILEPLNLAPENLLVTDSVDDPFDHLIDYGTRPLNTVNTEYVWFYNRGDSPVTITSFSLETEDVFQFPEQGTPDYQAPPIVIMPGLSANIPVIFAPTDFPLTGERTLTDILTVQTSERASPYVFDLTAELAGANLIVLENSGLEENDDQMDLGSVRVNNSSNATFTLQNLGDQDLYINSIEFNSGNLSAFSYTFIGGGNLPFTLKPFDPNSTDDSAQFLLTFTPGYTGDFNDTLIIHSSDSAGDYLVELTGVGIAPGLVVQESLGNANDNYLPFGWRPLNQPASTNVILSNDGTDALTLYGWEFQNAIPNDFDVNPVVDPDPAVTQDDIILQPGESQTLTITFLASMEGSFNDTLIIYSDDGQHMINLSSLAGQSALPSLGFEYGGVPYDSLALDIGNVSLGQSASEPFKIVNNGLVELTVNSISVVGEGFSLVGADLSQPLVLQQGDAYQLRVIFDATPDLSIQNFQSTITIDSTAPQMIVPVSAAIVTPEINVSSTLLDFGAIDEGQQKILNLQISNSGNTDLVITNWSTQDSQFSIDVPAQNLMDNNLVIASNQTVTVAVTFDPQQFGITEIPWNLISNDYDEPVTTITLAAQSLGRPFSIPPNTSYAFYDADGDLVTVSLNEGHATLYLNNGLLNNADINSLMLYDTTPNSELKITVSGGQTSVGSIQSDGSLSSINSPKVTINHSIDINGSLDELMLNNVSNNADIHVAQYSSKPMTVKVEKIGPQVNFDLASNIKTFQASSYTGGNLTAPQIDLLKITNGSLGANVTLGSGGLKKLDVYDNITGNVQAFDSIDKATSKTGGISGSLTALTGGIGKVTAKKNITGDIFADQNVDKIIAKQGAFTSTLRAVNVDKIIAYNIDGAVVSTAEDIGKVIAKNDVRDSFFLAGYDITMNGLADMDDNQLSGGSVKNFKFGRELSNTFVTAGVFTNIIQEALVGYPPDFQLDLSSYGSITINGKIVQTDAGASDFGFLAIDDISSNLYDQQADNFHITENLG